MKSIHSFKNSFLAAGSYAITHIPNCCMDKMLSFLTIAKVPRKQIENNLSANRNILTATAQENSGFFTPGHFIENQNEWESVRFGQSTMKYSGCEIMAVYNALLDLGNRITAQDMADLIGEFERKGAELRGRWGCSPRSIGKYLSRRGYGVTMSTSKKTDTINAIGENSDCVIITAYNDRNDIRKMIHTICVTKNRHGGYTLHNAYRRIDGRYAAYGGKDSIRTLFDAIGTMAQGQASPICIIGIQRPEVATKAFSGSEG